ncbi:MAG: CDP-diacylglycerol-phosphatidylglycerol phosphatidyltransferase [Candidatus Saccharibacteria bacterium]|nr:CDP-diacylglycerol-phosphatidylglycerol phosphatidyltransferase [Candidatus Saccharibacteria bacterium]
MNLHRTSGKPDWENVKQVDRNIFQRLSAKTYGIISPANIITLIGLGIVIYGLIAILRQQFWLGLVLLAIGRLLDIIDGVVAESTQTKSPLGELFDAASDKVGTLLTIIVLIFAGITYWWVILALVIPQAVIPLVTFYKKTKGTNIHPTRQGKLSMATAWVGIVGLVIVKALNGFWPLAVGIYIVIGLSLTLGLYALWQYSTNRD